MTGDGMNGVVVGNIHALKISDIKGGVVGETKAASRVAELDGFVDNGAKDAEGVEVQRKGFEGGEAEDGVGGDIIAKGEGDGDVVAIAVKVGS